MDAMIWAYLIHLGSDMWGDRQTVSRTPFYHTDSLYQETMLTDRDVWRKTTDFMAGQGVNTLVIDLGEGVRYESHPELAVPGSWSVDELKEELNRLRGISLTPVPKLNFSACHDAWLGPYRMMRCTDTYYAVCNELIDEVCAIFGRPQLFHLGMDEETYEHQKHMGSAFIRGEALWWHDFLGFVDRCEKNGARPWIWSDYYWHHPDIFVKRMPKSVLQSNWSYHRIAPPDASGWYPDISYQAYVDLDRLGYDQVPTASTWCFHGNIEQTVRLPFEAGLDKKRILGFMTAPWQFTTEENLYTLMDDAYRLGLCRKWYEKEYR